MPKYTFLSDEWVREAHRIYAEAAAGRTIAPGATSPPVRVNLIVAEVPFSGTPVDAHVDTSEGRLDIGTGHLIDPDVTVSVGYETARSLFVQGDVQTVLQAFLAGRIKVDGDLSKLLDPRSGIWPGGPAGGVPQPAGEGTGTSEATGRGEGAGPSEAAGQAERAGQEEGAGSPPVQQGLGLGFGGPEALQVASRLQEITE